MTTRPFSGARILDFTEVLAGPYVSYQFALLGAEMIKIERRGGEDMRRTPLSRLWAERTMAQAFVAVNGNRKSLTLDLQKPAARAIVLRLAEKADVVMMTAIGRADMLDDPRFGDRFPRREYEADLRAIIETAPAADSKVWERRPNDAGAPCALIWKIEEIIDHPQIAARGVMQTVDSPYGPLRLMGLGFHMAHGSGRLDHRASGADTGSVLTELDFNAAEIAALRAEAVI